MPHLEVASAPQECPVDQRKTADAENDTVRADADVLLALATTASKQVHGSENRVKQTSPHHSEEQGHQVKRNGTPASAPVPPATPSPPQARGYEAPEWVGHAAHSPPTGYAGNSTGGQVLGVYGGGNRVLYASPIRRENDSEGPPQEKNREGKPEENRSPGSHHLEAGRALHYRPDMTRGPYYGAPPGAPPHMMPPVYGYRYHPHVPLHTHGYDERYMHPHSPTHSFLKRTATEDRSTQSSPKKQQLSKEKPVDGKLVNTKDIPTEFLPRHLWKAIPRLMKTTLPSKISLRLVLQRDRLFDTCLRARTVVLTLCDPLFLPTLIIPVHQEVHYMQVTTVHPERLGE
jgi:hypothetical protein